MTDENKRPVLFGAWLSETRKLQEEAYGFDFEAMARDQQAHSTYFVVNHTAAVVELGEMLEEVRWKPWATLAERDSVVPDRRAVIKEAVDAMHFISNFLCAAGATDEELNTEYLAKMDVNRERQLRAGGYQSRRGIDKCVSCLRSFDDVGKSEAAEGYCLKCETELIKQSGLGA